MHASLSILRLGVNVWLSDVDIAFIRDPWPAFQLALPCELEVFATWKRPGLLEPSNLHSFNSGFARMRANGSVAALLEDTLEHSFRRGWKFDDQKLMLEVIIGWINHNRTRLLPPLPPGSDTAANGTVAQL